MEKEISSGKIQKEAFCKTALCRLNGSDSVKLLFSLSSFLTLCMLSLWWDTREHFEAYGEKGNMLNQNWREAFWETALWRVHSTHSVIPLFSYSVGETLLEKQVPSDIREHVDDDDEKGNSLRLKLEKAFWKTTLWYVQSSHIDNGFFTLRCLETVMDRSTKGQLGALWGLWWKTKYLQKKTGKKLSVSVNLIFAMFINLT